MNGVGKYVLGALVIAILAHFAYVNAVPRMLMSVAMSRIAGGERNAWRLAPRVTPDSRTIVRPSPDFAYSACSYDLSHGPVRIDVAPWDGYWSLSLYADNSDNFFVVDDREVEGGVHVMLSRSRPADNTDASVRVVQSPSVRGIALIRRLAPNADAYNAAAVAARGDACASAG